ncbi:hypothetical protein LP421_33200 (plasmid) [Rhizobium sp. RCAM05350]|uniref:hypothetical protein n=1 Tax=Rhizobium sp. RCAM05350 TaxID=2895568 RepID=UPI00207675D4|nr:hypothetical protein [Rhizobium sp. RCAM05350]URK89515.1 hypothetical protein LP421_33200 [Rhizobium sp. RCAM05350]
MAAKLTEHQDALIDMLMAANEALRSDEEKLRALIAENAPQKKIDELSRKVDNLESSIIRLNAFMK